MATTTKTAEQMNQERRLVKAKRKNRNAASKVAAETFSFAKLLEDKRNAKLRQREAEQFGREINALINGWLDEADSKIGKMVVFPANPSQVQQQAIEELVGWLSQNPEQPYMVHQRYYLARWQ